MIGADFAYDLKEHLEQAIEDVRAKALVGAGTGQAIVAQGVQDAVDLGAQPFFGVADAPTDFLLRLAGLEQVFEVLGAQPAGVAPLLLGSVHFVQGFVLALAQAQQRGTINF